MRIARFTPSVPIVTCLPCHATCLMGRVPNEEALVTDDDNSGTMSDNVDDPIK